jgi:large subunit ribosomal protein L6
LSRIGKLPVKIPKGVQVTVQGRKVEVKGSKGTLCREVNNGLAVAVDGDTMNLKPEVQNDTISALWGLNRVLLENMIIGVSAGYRKDLEIVGVGYKAEMKGKDINLAVGLSSPVLYKAPEGIKLNVENQVKISIEGIDKEKVGQTAAEIRHIRPPEPYKGKGIRYSGEHLRRKAGKTAGK